MLEHMSEGTVGLVVFAAIAILSAILWHRFIRIFALATTGATVTAVVAFQYAAYLHLGYMDKFWIIAVITTSVMALVLSIVIGLPFQKYRKAGSNERHKL